MSRLRELRTGKSLTFLDLARLTGISARTIAEVEYGMRALSGGDRERLAFALGVRASDIAPPQPAAHAASRPDTALAGAPALIAVALAATLATAAIQGELPRIQAPQPLAQASLMQPAPPLGRAIVSGLSAISARDAVVSAQRASLEALARRAAAPAEPIAPALLLTPMPAEPAPSFQLTAAGPLGCPVQPTQGKVVITQGYGVGSHAPAQIWGAVDLAVDADGDGYAEAGPTWYTPVVATHAGIVRVDLDSYPAGNHVWVSEGGQGWRTGYAHLAMVTVISGQNVRAGEVIGLIGSSGQSSGPHLDYQVWHGETNIDPTSLVSC